MKLNWIFPQSIGFCYLKTKVFTNTSTACTRMAWLAVTKQFRARHKSEFGEHLATQASNNVWKNKKAMIVSIIFGNKLLSSFLMSAICSFLKYLCYRQTKTSSGNVDIAQLRFGSPRRYPFLTLRRPHWGLNLVPYFGYHWARSTNHRCVNLLRHVFLNISAEPWW